MNGSQNVFWSLLLQQIKYQNLKQYYVPAVTLSTQDNAKILQQLQSGFKRTVNCNKCQFKKNPEQNRYLDFLINPSFQTANRLFVSSFK